jgi:hypothetical protein
MGKRLWRILLIYAGWVTYVNLLLYVLVSESSKTLFQHSLLSADHPRIAMEVRIRPHLGSWIRIVYTHLA